MVMVSGAGGRADPTRVRLADLSESTEDPLSRAVRMRLRRLHGIQDGIPVVFSTEKPKAGLLPFEAPGGVEANPADYQVRHPHYCVSRAGRDRNLCDIFILAISNAPDPEQACLLM